MSSSELTDNDLTFTADGIISAASNLTLQNSTGTPFIWPTTDPAVNGYVLSSTTGGTMSWVAQSGGGGSSSGASGAIQLSDGSGGFNGDTSLLLFDDFTTPGDSRLMVANTGSTTTPYSFGGGTQNLYTEIRGNASNAVISFNCGTTGSSSINFITGSNTTPDARILYDTTTGLTFSTVGSIQPINVLSTNGITLSTQFNAGVGIQMTTTSGNIRLTASNEIILINNNGPTISLTWPTSVGTVGQGLQVLSFSLGTGTLHWG